MPDRVPAQPTLYDVGTSGAPPHLLGRRCATCGYVFFPPHDFGCESCGAPPAAVTPVELRGSGALLASAVVRFSPVPEPPTPFTVASIVLDDGPVIRAVLREGDGLEPGGRLQAVLVATGTDAHGSEIVELRFEPTRDRPQDDD